MTEDAGMEKKMEQNTEENVIGQGIEDDRFTIVFFLNQSVDI